MPPKPQPWPADQVERRPTESLIAYARNARTHSPAQVDQIAASVREWGWTTPVLVAEDNTILAGHGRVLAAQKLGLTDIPVMIARGWSEAQRRAYVIADNKLALNADWDDEMLKLELTDLSDSGFDTDLLGFDQGELDHIKNGWQPDITRIERVDPEMAGLEALVKVRCKNEDEQQVIAVIESALREAAIDGARIVG